MPRVCRIHDQNSLKTSGAVIVADSYASSFPPSNLLDQLRSKVWRSELGWVFVEDENDLFDFNRGGVKMARIAAGLYVTGAQVAAALQAALEAADPTPVWSVTYSTTTFKFTIASDLAFTILSGTGGFLGFSIYKDLGYATGADTGSATSHTAGEVSYQSRHTLRVNLPAAETMSVAWLLDHNVSASGVVKFVVSDFDLDGWGLDEFPAPNGDEFNLPGNLELRIAYVAGAAFRYLRFVIDDVQNPTGYAEVGIAYAGNCRQPSVGYSVNFQEEGDDLSEIERATEGALYGDLRPEAPAWGLEFLEVPEADADLFRAHRSAMPKGKCFGLAFDAANDATDFAYGFRDGGLPIQAAAAGVYWTASFTFREALP